MKKNPAKQVDPKALLENARAMAQRKPDVKKVLEDAKVQSPFADVNYQGDYELDGAAEMTALQRSFADADKRQEEILALQNDPEYIVSIVFKSRDQKEDFINQVGWWQFGIGSIDAKEIRFIDGPAMCKAENIPLPEIKLPDYSRQVDKKLKALTRK